LLPEVALIPELMLVLGKAVGVTNPEAGALAVALYVMFGDTVLFNNIALVVFGSNSAKWLLLSFLKKQSDPTSLLGI